MKEEMAWAFIALLKLGVIWVLIGVAAIVACFAVKRWSLRVGFVLAALASVPVYVVMQGLVARKQEADHWAARRAVAAKESEAWARICQLPPELKVHATVPSAEAVDVRIRQPNDMYNLDPHMPAGSKKSVCWLEPEATRCTKAHIANVQTEWVSTASWCQPDAAAYKRDDCHVMWNISMADQKRERIQKVTAAYILDVHRPERLSPLIERFRVTVLDEKTNTLLAEAVIHQKSWLGDIQRPPGTENEARHCPDRDEAIGKMLEGVFPGAAR
ncbi:hypothetical protein HHL11_15895 [Ramlibacter sp. G-1-2-2]|uniref:Uncharacterized protein n=1 Tax=Ramlibacter agri TaxID=2728837 RepID=A0A848H403_9BURK|nr:hypothetical protein [Ramlibacter agri]NML45237.1 hypothetical protein [Ramlibacter agri]